MTMVSPLTTVRQRRHRRDRARRSASRRSQRTVLGLGFAVGAAAVVLTLALTLAYASLTRGLPSLDELPVLLDPHSGLLLQPTRLYDRTGQHLLASLSPTDADRIYALYDYIPKSLRDATLAIVQPDFWASPGYTMAGWQDADSHPTLAQQLIYSLLLWDEPATPLRAIHERMLAAQVTSRYGRQQVLEWYLNSADYGHYAYGAEAAAQFYLAKSVTQITLSEAALLAAIGQAPALNPVDAPNAAEDRRVETLGAMLAQGLITSDEAAQAIDDPPSPGGRGAGDEGKDNIAPAFVNLVLAQLDSRFGAGRIERGGLAILTSLDYDLQIQTACAIRAQLARLTVRPAGSGSEATAAGDTGLDGTACAAARLLPALQRGDSEFVGASTALDPGASASALVLDPTTGQVLAAVGDMRGGQQGSLLAQHPAGTSILPFVYLTGFSRGLNPASLGWDIPVSTNSGGTPALGQVYHGPVRLRIALVNDYLPPAQRLLQQMGEESVRAISAPFGLSIPLGARLLEDDFDLSPLELAAAYGILANGGTLVGQPQSSTELEPVAVLQVTGLDHSVWLDWRTSQDQAVVSPQLAYLMDHILSDETARWPSFGNPSPLEIGRPAGAKASRTLDGLGTWTVGSTPGRVIVVWLG